MRENTPLISDLADATRQLAARQLASFDDEVHCLECKFSWVKGKEPKHGASCIVGRAAVLIAELSVGLAEDVCPHCGPECRGAVAHHARKEDGVVFCVPNLSGEPVQSYQEPWHFDAGTGQLKDNFGFTISDLAASDLDEGIDAKTLLRIADCVNFCEGLPSQYLHEGMPQPLEAVAR